MNTFIFRNEYILQTSSKAPTHNGAYTQFRRFGSTCNGEATETCNPAYSSVWMKTPHKRVLTKNIPHQRYLSSFLIVVCIFFSLLYIVRQCRAAEHTSLACCCLFCVLAFICFYSGLQCAYYIYCVVGVGHILCDSMYIEHGTNCSYFSNLVARPMSVGM